MLFCDNCPSQNKNKYVAYFIYWLVHYAEVFDQIELIFFQECHAKCNCDGEFGCQKKKFRDMDSCYSIEDIETMIKNHCDGTNKSLLVRKFDTNEK